MILSEFNFREILSIYIILSAKYNVRMNSTQIAKLLGSLGGKARAKKMSAEERKRIAAAGGHARAESIKLAKRIRANFHYVAVVEALRPKRKKIVRYKMASQRLPGIYRHE